MPTRRALVLSTAAVLALGTVATSCGRGGSGGRRDVPTPAVIGVLLDYTDQPAREVPVRVRGGVAGESHVDGLVALGPVAPGAGVLIVGDSVSTPTLLVPFSAVDPYTFFERPIHVPDLESGISAAVTLGPGGALSSALTVAGEALPGVTLDLAGGTVVDGAAGEVRVVPLSPSRLPLPVPSGGGEPRAGFLVEPHGVTFSPAATLSVPRLDPLASGPFDAYRVDPTSGQWVLHQTGLVATGPGSGSIALDVDIGTLYAIVPQAAPATVDVTGRIVAGTQPVAGYRASCWNRVSAPTGSDGTFTIPDVPDLGVFLVRAYPAEPGELFAPEVVLSATTTPTLGDLAVTARRADRIRPTVRSTSPADDAVNVDRRTHVVVVFSEAIDPARDAPFELLGTNGRVDGQYNFDNPFTVRFRPNQTLDPADTYTILADRRVEDLAGNRLDDDAIAFQFTTRAGAPDPPPVDTLAFGLDPLSGARGAVVTVPGRNYTGGSVVTFGGTAGLVRNETSEVIEVEVPDFEPAGDVTVSVSTGGVAVGALKPLVFDLRASVARIVSGTATGDPLEVYDPTAAHGVLTVEGHNVGGAALTVDGVPFAASDATVVVGGVTVATGRVLSVGTPPALLVSGPVVLRGANGRPSATYRFLLVRGD